MAGRDLYGRTLGEFVLREQIDEGGYGTVYRAEQPALKRDVVVKVLHEPRRDARAEERFLREAQLASQLAHPYAAHVYASGCESKDGLLWIAMERAHGITLADWLELYGPMPLEQYVPLFECIAEVVQAAHDLGIVHRDLKPSNIMVRERRGGHLFPKLLDFGIAKMSSDVTSLMPEDWLDDGFAGDGEPVCASSDDLATARITLQRGQRTPANRLTPSGKGFGSFAYMPPEQWRNAKAVGPGADIYALGVVSYEVLSGSLPFTAGSPDEYCLLHCAKLPPQLRVEPRPELDRVIQRALAKGPQGRQRTVLEMASGLRAALRATKREQLRSAAQQWEDEDRAPSLLWGPDMLAELELQVSPEELSESECSFVTDSQRRVRRNRWLWRSLGALAVMVVFGILLYRAEMRARTAQEVAEATFTQSELEQGRAALLHGEPDAQSHLAEAYRRDHSPSTAFMYARALQPRLAEQARFTSTSGRTWSAAFSPDGQRILTTDDQSAQVRDAQTGRLLLTLPHGDTVYHGVYSTDGARLVTAGGDGTVKIWDAASGTLVRELRRDGAKPRYYLVALSPDGKLVAAIDLKGEVTHVWDASSGALIAELHDDGSAFPGLAFSADGHWLATSGGNDVRVFDVQTWAQVVAIPGPRIHALGFDPTGPRLLTGSAEGDASIWAIPDGARLHHLREIGEPVDAVAFSSNGQLVVAASRDGAEQVWKTTNGKLQSQGNYLRGKILSIEFDPTSKLMVAAGASGNVVVSDAALGMPVVVLDGPANVVRVAHFDPSSRRIIGASWDGTARVWEAASPYQRWGSPPLADDCGLSTSLDPDGRFVPVACKDHQVYVWDTRRAQLLAELPSVVPASDDFESAYPAVSAAGDRAAIVRGNTVELYQLPGDKVARTITQGAMVDTVVFASTGHDLVSGAVDGSLLVTRDGRAPLALLPFPDGIDAVSFLADGRVAAAAGRRLRIYDPDRNIVLAEFSVPDRVRMLRPSPDSRRLISVPSFRLGNAAPVLWDIQRYRFVAKLEGAQVYSARFATGGREIVTACADGAARFWDGETGQLRQTYRGGPRFLLDATLAPDGSMVVAGGGDGLLRFWDTITGRPLWTMPAHKSFLVSVHFDGNDIVTRGFSGEISRWTLPNPEQVFEACGHHKGCAMMPK